ncbi:hypothetical protein VNO80_14719 [Phaseolus coccineus]|uniref:Uncharacterized protein n=1 Tax=Phaseolus coccineus TaxID=3886 RepID=A0AAN9MPZ8_PHACN
MRPNDSVALTLPIMSLSKPVSGVNKKHLIVSIQIYVRTELKSSSDVIIKTKTKQCRKNRICLHFFCLCPSAASIVSDHKP